jgi:hypothetical protein
MEHQELLSGLVRLHVLHHAAEGDLYGNWMIEELAGHGYKISPGAALSDAARPGTQGLSHLANGPMSPLATRRLPSDAVRRGDGAGESKGTGAGSGALGPARGRLTG